MLAGSPRAGCTRPGPADAKSLAMWSVFPSPVECLPEPYWLAHSGTPTPPPTKPLLPPCLSASQTLTSSFNSHTGGDGPTSSDDAESAGRGAAAEDSLQRAARRVRRCCYNSYMTAGSAPDLRITQQGLSPKQIPAQIRHSTDGPGLFVHVGT